MRRIGLLLLALSAYATHAHAQGGGDVDSRYQSMVEEAVMEFGEGRYAEARALFAQAHQLRPNARTLRGLGMTAFELRNYTEALRMLRASQLSRINPLTAQQQEHVAGLIDRAEAFVGTYTVRAPEGTTFAVDGISKQVDEDGTLMLDTGKRTVVATFPGGAREERAVDVRGRERGILEFHAPEPEKPVAAAAPAEEGQQAAEQPMPEPGAPEEAKSDLLPWILVGSGGALVVAGIFTGIAAYQNASVVDERCPNGTPCDGQLGKVKDLAETLALTTDILWVVGAAAAGTGAFLLFSGDGESASIDASVAMSPGGGGVLLRGKF